MFNIETRGRRQEARSRGLKKTGCNRIFFSCIFSLISFFFAIAANAQCAMCRASLESEGNAVKAEAVNDGIVYLMAIPYILVGAVGYYVYRTRIKK